MIELTPLLENLLITAMIVLAFLSAGCLVRAAKGPNFTDRLMAVNIICTLVVVFLAILAYLQGHSYLLDIAILYALLNVVALEILTRVIISHIRSDNKDQEKEDPK